VQTHLNFEDDLTCFMHGIQGSWFEIGAGFRGPSAVECRWKVHFSLGMHLPPTYRGRRSAVSRRSLI